MSLFRSPSRPMAAQVPGTGKQRPPRAPQKTAFCSFSVPPGLAVRSLKERGGAGDSEQKSREYCDREFHGAVQVGARELAGSSFANLSSRRREQELWTVSSVSRPRRPPRVAKHVPAQAPPAGRGGWVSRRANARAFVKLRKLRCWRAKPPSAARQGEWRPARTREIFTCREVGRGRKIWRQNHGAAAIGHG